MIIVPSKMKPSLYQTLKVVNTSNFSWSFERIFSV